MKRISHGSRVGDAGEAPDDQRASGRHLRQDRLVQDVTERVSAQDADGDRGRRKGRGRSAIPRTPRSGTGRPPSPGTREGDRATRSRGSAWPREPMPSRPATRSKRAESVPHRADQNRKRHLETAVAAVLDDEVLPVLRGPRIGVALVEEVVDAGRELEPPGRSAEPRSVKLAIVAEPGCAPASVVRRELRYQPSTPAVRRLPKQRPGHRRLEPCGAGSS